MITYRRIPSTDPRLGRHVHHDDRSRAFAYPTAGLTLQSAQHVRRIPVLDQGDLGSCTGNAGIGCLGTEADADSRTAGRPGRGARRRRPPVGARAPHRSRR